MQDPRDTNRPNLELLASPVAIDLDLELQSLWLDCPTREALQWRYIKILAQEPDLKGRLVHHDIRKVDLEGQAFGPVVNLAPQAEVVILCSLECSRL